MKKIAVFCIVAVLVAGYFYSRIDDGSIKYSSNEKFSAKTGCYEIGQSATLKIYEITESGEVYFDVFWARANGFGGVAKSISKEKASFEIAYQEEAKVYGNLNLQENNIVIEVEECSLEYIETGTYTFEYSNPIDKDYTEVGSYISGYLGQEKYTHEFFEQFAEEYASSFASDWIYLGCTNYLFSHMFYDEEDLGFLDFYKIVTFDSKTRYYALDVEYSNALDKIVAYEVDSDGVLNKVWEEDVNSIISKESSYTYNEPTYDDIPRISVSSNMLNADFETLKIRMGQDLSGPYDSWRSNSEKLFYLKNITGVNCYMNISSNNELLGVKNGEIVFYGMYGLGTSAKVKDILPDSALTTTPAIYTIQEGDFSSLKAGKDSYVWKLNNGYMAIIVVADPSRKFYDQYASNVIYVTDLSYLSYID